MQVTIAIALNAISLGYLKQFRNYCVLIEISRCGFHWEKTTKRPTPSVYTNCETARVPSSHESMAEAQNGHQHSVNGTGTQN
jgi:hypothetical protein